jgi:hypothetical protein
MKQNKQHTHYCLIGLALFFLFSVNSLFAQGNLWEEGQAELFEEPDMKSNPFLNRNSDYYSSKKLFKEEQEIIGNRMDVTANSDGIFGIGMTKSESRKMDGGPFTLPGGPDAPINSRIYYLVFVGLIYAVYTINRAKLKL